MTCSCAHSDGTRFRNTEFFRTETGRITQVEVYFGSETAADGQEAELRALLEDVSAAVRRKDATALVSPYASDVVAFDVVDPLTVSRQGRGEASGRRLARFMAWRDRV